MTCCSGSSQQQPNPRHGFHGILWGILCKKYMGACIDPLSQDQVSFSAIALHQPKLEAPVQMSCLTLRDFHKLSSNT